MNMETINAELRKKFKRMSREDFNKYIYKLDDMWIKVHPEYSYDITPSSYYSVGQAASARLHECY